MMVVLNAKQMIDRIQQRAFDLCEHITLINTCPVTINEDIFPILKTIILIRIPGVTITHSTLEAAYFVYCNDTDPLSIKDSPELKVFEYGCSEGVKTQIQCEAFNTRLLTLTPTQILGVLNKNKVCHLDPVQNLLLLDEQFQHQDNELEEARNEAGTDSEDDLMYYSRTMIESSHEIQKKMDERYKQLMKERKALEAKIKKNDKLLYGSQVGSQSVHNSRYFGTSSGISASYLGSPMIIPRKMDDSGFQNIQQRVFKNRYDLVTSVNAGVQEERLNKLKNQIQNLSKSDKRYSKESLRLTDIK